MVRALLVALCLLLAACSAKPELRDFTPPGQAFVVGMPGAPRHEQQTVDTPAGKITTHLHVAEFDDVVYAVNYLPMPEAAVQAMPRMGTPEALAHGRASLMASAPGATLLRESFNTARVGASNLATGNEYALQMPGGATMTVRQFVHRGVFYQVATTVPVRPSYNQELYAERFLDSFRLD
ncbi:hypothetical protein [Arenimonas sp. MALMAid1274]|uniref:hypothetical protein n=1 Tax=Arenimonas sp. MALMAid1274 TaxID=3411630 RepID=UPI003BA02683